MEEYIEKGSKGIMEQQSIYIKNNTGKKAKLR